MLSWRLIVVDGSLSSFCDGGVIQRLELVFDDIVGSSSLVSFPPLGNPPLLVTSPPYRRVVIAEFVVIAFFLDSVKDAKASDRENKIATMGIMLVAVLRMYFFLIMIVVIVAPCVVVFCDSMCKSLPSNFNNVTAFVHRILLNLIDRNVATSFGGSNAMDI